MPGNAQMLLLQIKKPAIFNLGMAGFFYLNAHKFV